MPIKLPKGFTRRKSSGNALEEVEPPTQPSFRVFERHPGQRKSFSDVNLLSQNVGEPSHPPPEDLENIFAGSEKPTHTNRGSGGADQSGFTGPMYESSSSVCFSSSSACSSSAKALTQNHSQSPHSRPLHDIPVPPLTGALRAAGRTFSLGGRLSKLSTPSPPTPPPHPQHSTIAAPRERSMTGNAARATSPPKLLDTGLSLGTLEDDFQSAFDNIGLESGGASQERFPGKPIDPDSQIPSSHSPTASPRATDTHWSNHDDASPYLLDKRHSEGRLSFVFDSENQAFLAPDPVSPHPDSTSNIPTTTHRSLGKPKPGKALRRSIVHTEKRDSSFIDDEDAKLVMESLLSSKGTPPARLPPEREDSDAESDTSLFEDAGAFDRSGWTAPVSSPGIGDSQADASIAAHARLVARYEGGTSVPASSPNKVMTPSQFEHYRQQQELRRTNSDASKSDDCVDSEFDEEDEAENNREAEKQRRKQEAHMSVYRQQMMKVTGQQASAPSLRPPMEVTNNSTPNLGTHSPKQGSKSGSGKSSEGDEDDEVPLAILAAHGFPNRNRPPNHLGSSKSIPNLRASFQPHMSSGIVPADHDPSSRGSLPVFARNLPRDPYFGASLVNNSNRESLALGGGSHPGGPPPNLPPGGLVGVIASEERARAIRRGSPNAHGSYEPQLGMPGTKPHFNPYPSMPTNVQGVSGPQYGPSPSENTQIQLSQQMTQMMHTQMQWMQQMMQMQGMQGAPQLQIPRGFPPSSLANADVRPVSMPSGPALGMGPAGPRTDQRTLSMLDPNIPSRWNSLQMPYNPADGNRPGTPSGQGYPPSIAPSERSNIGMAPRYRPVSTIQQEQRSNTLQSASRPWGDENRKSISIASQSQFNLEKMTPPPTVTIRPVSSSGKGLGPLDKGFDDEADDDEGWAEMMKKRQQKKDGWKAKRATTALGDLMNAVH